jgi:hypothetical protein
MHIFYSILHFEPFLEAGYVLLVKELHLVKINVHVFFMFAYTVTKLLEIPILQASFFELLIFGVLGLNDFDHELGPQVIHFIL